MALVNHVVNTFSSSSASYLGIYYCYVQPKDTSSHIVTKTSSTKRACTCAVEKNSRRELMVC